MRALAVELMSFVNSVGYAGDMTAADAYKTLRNDRASRLIDVRTKAEWSYVGAPLLEDLGRSPFFLEWQSFPSMDVDPAFSNRLAEMLENAEVERGAKLFFICRSGSRSRQAAIAMTNAGWGPCFNIADGFEGPLDALRHRGAASGWKAAGLPWIQT